MTPSRVLTANRLWKCVTIPRIGSMHMPGPENEKKGKKERKSV
jgi:hypothetical protein